MPDKSYDFSETLPDLDAGIFLDKLSRAIAETANAVAYHEGRAKGKVVIDLSIERFGVYLSPGHYKLIPYSDTTDWSVFLAAMSLHNWRKRYAA